ncbi:glycosyltransferase [Stutzerimonas zhaodongensis]|uniref:CgeB family protein n=1 Tax=Stutzerimonas zhaodongensis TaxID=1176257 RepID=UPI0039EFABE8
MALVHHAGDGATGNRKFIESLMKIIILDGISGVPLGKEIHGAFQGAGVSSVYADAFHFKARPFYRLSSIVLKSRNRMRDKEGFSHLPRIELKELEALIERERPTHVLVIGFLYKHFEVRAARELLNKHGVSLLLYDTDSCNLYGKRREFVYFIQQELPVYDHIFSFSKVTTRFFQDTLGLKASHLPFGALPVHALGLQKTAEALFVGSADLRRVFLLEGVRNRVAIRGNRWKRNYPLMSSALRARVDDRTVWGEELQMLLQSAKIVINITRSDFYGAETGVNLRIFEALSAGCFLLTDYCEEIAELFTPGQDIEVFRSATELRAKVAYYLENEEERERIARNGRARFLEHHTWAARIDQIGSTLAAVD